METKLPKISIVIPSFNKGKYIKQTLQSIVDQNYPKVEVIIQDGGSTDKTKEIVLKFVKQYPKIINFVSKKDKGQTDAVNTGLKKAKGEIVTYINADDYYLENALWKVANFFMQNPKELWVAGFGKTVTGSGKETAKIVTLYKSFLQTLCNRNLLFIVNYLHQPSVFYKKNFIMQFGGFVGVGKIILEYEMWLKMSQKRMHGNITTALSAFRLLEDGFSTENMEKILGAQEEFVRSYTSDPVVLLLHRFNNWGRTWMVKVFGGKK